MPKILFISYDGMTDPLGQSQVIPYLKGLSQSGYEFTILSCEKPRNFFLHKNQVKELLALANIQWVPLRYHKKPPVISTIFDVLQLKQKAFELHKNKGFDMVHTRPGIPALIGLELKRKFGIKFLNDIREFYADSRIEGDIWNEKNIFYRRIYRYFKQKEKDAVERNDGVVCLTFAAEKIIRQWPNFKNGLPLQVIPCSVDLKLFDPEKIDTSLKEDFKNQWKIHNDDFIISYLGSIGSWYLLEEMMQFFKVISAKIPNAKFLFISPSCKNEILLKAKNAGLTEEKLLIQKAKRNEVPALLSLSRISVFFIKPCYSKQSSSPTKHAEIMAMGIPVISNDGVGDVAQIIENTKSGLVLKELKKEEFERVANTITENFIFDKDRIRQSGAEYYDLEKAIQKYKIIYDQLCKCNSNASEN
jgi:glycosyltransferase involved in cell wall biosynthesis